MERTVTSTDNSVDVKVSKNDQQMVFDSINIGDKMVKKKERKI